MHRRLLSVHYSAVVLVALAACGGKKDGTIAAAPQVPVDAPPAAPEMTPAEKEAAIAGSIKGASRWKDTAVYLDGQPIGVLAFGELPIGLEPYWKEDKASIPVKPGTAKTAPHWKIEKQRHYRFVDYLRAMGVDPRKVKEIHVYGPRFSETIIATGEELASEKGKGFMFRFGGEVYGKAIPVVPDDFGNGRSPDKISSVMIYIEKTPPKLVWNKGMELDGEMVTNVPYYGAPVRGGVRIYLDNRIVTIIKRHELAEKATTGNNVWPLFDYLESQGVDTSQIAEAWAIRGEVRKEKFSREQLLKMTFQADGQARGAIRLGDDKVVANVLALHTKPVKPSQLPVIMPGEEPRGPEAMPGEGEKHDRDEQ